MKLNLVFLPLVCNLYEAAFHKLRQLGYNYFGTDCICFLFQVSSQLFTRNEALRRNRHWSIHVDRPVIEKELLVQKKIIDSEPYPTEIYRRRHRLGQPSSCQLWYASI
ncbi:hypothetical protein AVEN_232773-1 [Araneus ventricosus]|uniref:Uncharacterized protein n=1 Tax=Araneus ventricosus TaxID=182803 RepID=A0A4Y2QSN5_ARAVE|nr:hypothetical protein AVEN_232773-1 [Araneus ventricosus]